MIKENKGKDLLFIKNKKKGKPGEVNEKTVTNVTATIVKVSFPFFTYRLIFSSHTFQSSLPQIQYPVMIHFIINLARLQYLALCHCNVGTFFFQFVLNSLFKEKKKVILKSWTCYPLPLPFINIVIYFKRILEILLNNLTIII